MALTDKVSALLASAAVRFSVRGWAAWAPGLAGADAWRAWALRPLLPAGDQRPELAQFPPMLRRRAERLARMALETTQTLREGTDCPKIFASARGETQRSVHLMRELAQEGRMTPGSFSLSVHNAVAALDSLAHGDTGNYSAIAAGAESAEAALVEACALLADGHPQVLVTVYDETRPELYRDYAEEPDAAFAWSWLVVPAQPGSVIELSWRTNGQPPPDPDSAIVLPHALDVLRFYLSDDVTLNHDGPHHRWTWHRPA